MIYNLGRVVPIFKGDYNSATTYNFLDVVFYDNSSFVALDTTTGNLPTDTTHWLPVALKGITQNPTQAQMQQIISDVETYMHSTDFVYDADYTHIDVIDNHTSTSTTNALSANQGKVLYDLIDDVNHEVDDLTNSKQNANIPLYTGIVSSAYYPNSWIYNTGLSTGADLNVRVFPITQGNTYHIKGGFGSGGSSYMYAYYNGDTFIQAFDNALGQQSTTKEYDITVPNEGTITHIAIQGGLSDIASCKLKSGETWNIQEQVEENKSNIDELQDNFEQIGDDIDDLQVSKLDKTYPVYETTPQTASDTQYQTAHYIADTGTINGNTSGFSVLGFDCTEGQEFLITGSFGTGPSCLGVFKDNNGTTKDLVLQKLAGSPYNNQVVQNYYCIAPNGATKLYVQTKINLLPTPTCKLQTVSEYIQYSDVILQNKSDINDIQTDLAQLQSDFDETIYTEVDYPQTWQSNKTYTLSVGNAPSINTTSSYYAIYLQNLQVGDSVFVKARGGSSWKFGAKVKNGVVIELINNGSSPYEYTFVVDDTFDALVFNNYTGYISSPSCVLTRNEFTTSILQNEIEDLQETVEDIIEQGVGGEFNLLCFGNSFTQDTISYIPWLIKECEPNLKLNVYFTYMGGMPISQCLAYISNGTSIALNSSGTPTTKYENHGGWDRIYSYSNGEWVEPESGSSNYHKSYTLYKYEDGANGWVSQSEPTAASVLQMKNWDLITIQQAGSYNYGEWNYYFKPYVYQIQAELQKQVKHNFTLGYLMTHASYANTSSELLTRYNGIVQNGTKMLENTPVEIVMPYATALQNARTTYLDRFGAGGHLMGDTAHVSDGVGCLTCAYANTMAILDLIGSKKSIVGSQIYPDAAWLSSHNIPAVSSTIEGLSRYNVWLAQQCAVMATKYPLQLTDMVAKGMCGDTEIEIVNDTVYSSNPILSANNGDSWNTTLIAPTGFSISNVSVMMGTTDITSSVYDSSTHEINISNVSDKITITATII